MFPEYENKQFAHDDNKRLQQSTYIVVWKLEP